MKETGLEPATACLEGRYSQDHHLLDTNGLYRLIKGHFLVFTHAWQKCSHAYFAPADKSFHCVLLAGLHEVLYPMRSIPCFLTIRQGGIRTESFSTTSSFVLLGETIPAELPMTSRNG